MLLLKRSAVFFLVLGCLITQPFSGCWAAFEVVVFDCAQGNTVAAKYKKKTMLFDAGRTGSSKFVAHEDDKGGESISDSKYAIRTIVTAEEIKKLNCPPQRYGLAPVPKNNSVYRKEFIEHLKRYILGKNNENTLHAVFISHPDIDHYNIVTKAELNPKTFVLGGNYALYGSSFKTYVLNKNIVKDEHYGEDGSLGRYTSNELFTQHCTFGDAEEDPKVEILGANAGKTGKKEDKNEDSLIIKISQRYSLLIPGDAEAKTWEDAEATSGVDSLKADALLLSHHGSMTNSSTSESLLAKIQPKVCIISAGFQHNHPSASTIDLVLDYYKGTPYRVDPHFVTYQEGNLRKSILTNAPLFTTIDNGALKLDLGANELIINCARDYCPVPHPSFSDSELTLLSFDWSLDKKVIDLNSLKGLMGKSPLLADTPFGKEVYRVPKGTSEEEDYYYNLGEAFIRLDLWEEADDEAEEYFERKVSNVLKWFHTHKDIHEIKIKFNGVEWLE